MRGVCFIQKPIPSVKNYTFFSALSRLLCFWPSEHPFFSKLFPICKHFTITYFTFTLYPIFSFSHLFLFKFNLFPKCQEADLPLSPFSPPDGEPLLFCVMLSLLEFGLSPLREVGKMDCHDYHLPADTPSSLLLCGLSSWLSGLRHLFDGPLKNAVAVLFIG
jgi:hypothetical protein